MAENLIRSKGHCPSFFLAVSGPWLYILGAVYSEQVTVEPLGDDRLHFISRLFESLKQAIAVLRDYYDSPGQNLYNPQILHPSG